MLHILSLDWAMLVTVFLALYSVSLKRRAPVAHAVSIGGAKRQELAVEAIEYCRSFVKEKRHLRVYVLKHISRMSLCEQMFIIIVQLSKFPCA